METHAVQCMEVWGGNRLVEASVALPGIEAWVCSRPHAGAAEGGDVHYVSSCATGRITRLLVADVSGHGQKVATLGRSLRALMHRNVNRLDPGRFVAAMNAEFAGVAAAAPQASFATAVVFTFFAPTNDLTVCNAGHPAPLLFRAATGEWSPVTARSEQPAAGPANLPLGLLEDSSYAAVGLALEPGDLVLAYTDSLIECRDAAGKLLGVRGLLEMVRGLDAAHPETLIPALLSRIEGLAPGNLGGDDLTALVFRATGRVRRAPLSALVRLPYLAARSILGRLRPDGDPIPWPDATPANVPGAFLPWLHRRWSRRNRNEGA